MLYITSLLKPYVSVYVGAQMLCMCEWIRKWLTHKQSREKVESGKKN